MLKSLNISNFAVIDRLEVKFDQGLNLLTGETGSGKSIIVDALGLILGGRGSASQIRTGERLSVIEGTFKVAGAAEEKVRGILEAAGIEKDKDEEIALRREMTSGGKSRVFVNEQMATTLVLRALQPFLVEIHGQGEQRALLSKQSHLKLLDAFGGCVTLRREVSEAFDRWKSARKGLALLEREVAERERTEDFLRYQLAEIQAIAPRAGEDEELLAEKSLLTHAEKILQLGSSAYAELYESDESVLAQLASIRRHLLELSEIDGRLGPTIETLEAGITSLTDVADGLRGYGEGIEFSPARLAQLESRLADLERLKRKYNGDLQEIINVQIELSEQLNRLSDLGAREVLQRESLEVARVDYIDRAARLTACRKSAAPELEKRVVEDLRHVAMEQARFVVSLKTSVPGQEAVSSQQEEEEAALGGTDETEGESFFSSWGADRVEFLLSANPGEDARPLSRIASGGELSRLMLTLRTVGTSVDAQPQSRETVVFDEIDVGIGGRVAEAVGRRLKALSETRQVLCVTHQPQIARFADQHYRVDKFVERGRTITIVKNLDREQRVGELARMIGGAEETTQTRETARWLLETAEKSNRRRKPRAKSSQKIADSHVGHK